MKLQAMAGGEFGMYASNNKLGLSQFMRWVRDVICWSSYNSLLYLMLPDRRTFWFAEPIYIDSYIPTTGEIKIYKPLILYSLAVEIYCREEFEHLEGFATGQRQILGGITYARRPNVPGRINAAPQAH